MLYLRDSAHDCVQCEPTVAVVVLNFEWVTLHSIKIDDGYIIVCHIEPPWISDYIVDQSGGGAGIESW